MVCTCILPKIMKDVSEKFEDTKGLNRRHKSMKYREHNGQKFEDTKGVTRRHKSKHNGQKKKDKRTKHTHKTKDRVTRTPLKTGGELRCTRRVNLVTNPVAVISHE